MFMIVKAPNQSSMAVRVLLVLAAFAVLSAVLYGCDQASSPPERQEKQAGVEEAKPHKPEELPRQATLKCEDFPDREAAQRYFDTYATQAESKVIDPDDNSRACDEGSYDFGALTATAAGASASVEGSAVRKERISSKERAEQEEANCRLVTYVSEENMSRQEGSALLERVATQMFEEMQDDPSATLGPAENKALDDLGVPRYPECRSAAAGPAEDKVFDILGVPRSFGPECRGPDPPRSP